MTYQELQKKYPNQEIKLIPDEYRGQYETFGFVSIQTFEQPAFGKKFTYHFMIEKEWIMRYFRDENEPDRILTEQELRTEYEALVASGETEDETFENHLTNCLGKNGMLVEVWKCSE